MNKPSISDDSWSYTVILFEKKTIIASRLSMTVSFSSFFLYMKLKSHKCPYKKNIFQHITYYPPWIIYPLLSDNLDILSWQIDRIIYTQRNWMTLLLMTYGGFQTLLRENSNIFEFRKTFKVMWLAFKS